MDETYNVCDVNAVTCVDYVRHVKTRDHRRLLAFVVCVYLRLEAQVVGGADACCMSGAAIAMALLV